MAKGQFWISVTVAVGLVGLIDLDADAKPNKQQGKTENAPARATILTTGSGLIHDGYGNTYVHEQVTDPVYTSDCLLLILPARDGVDQGRVTMFHRLPDGEQCSDGRNEDRSFGVSLTAFDLNDSGSVTAPEGNLIGQLRCFHIFADDNSDASCRFQIRDAGNGPVRWSIEWLSVTVLGNEDVRSVTSAGNAHIYKVVEVAANGNSRRTKTESQLQGEEPIPLAIEFERLSY